MTLYKFPSLVTTPSEFRTFPFPDRRTHTSAKKRPETFQPVSLKLFIYNRPDLLRHYPFYSNLFIDRLYPDPCSCLHFSL